MPLVRLEVNNFKSYRGHQLIGPFQSFSAVIGPNGSGKSNLMDAISFVLGVKSTQLRSSQLKDVIFRGRRMGADPENGDADEGQDDDGNDQGSSADATKATVVAVYEDATQKEWRFQRSITLAGVSEYRVNGRVTTWATYNATLEKFNVLVKAKNFLVFQGDVEAVASQNSRDLTKLIEQISGSLELKEEYEQAKVRMEKAQEDSASAFNKRRGINGELKTFREQKAEAEKWARLQEERDAHILQFLLWRLYHINEQLTSARNTIDQRNSDMSSLRQKQHQERNNVEARRKESATVKRDVSKLERDIKKRQREIEEKQPSLDAQDERTALSTRNISVAKRNITDVERDLVKHRAELAKFEQDYQRTKQAAQAAEQAEAARGRGPELSEAELNEYHELRAEASTRRATERQQLETLRRQLRAQQTTLKSLEAKNAQLEKSRERLETETPAAQERKDALDARQAELQGQLAAAKQQVEQLHSERVRIGKRETEVNETLVGCLTKLQQARSDAQESRREIKMKETFADLQRIFPGIRGRLVDLCKPTQHKYDSAISTVLGRHGDSLIVDHEKTAIACIEYLRNQRVGQATFLPLDTIQAKPINDRLRSIARGARLAIDIIQFDPTIERAMQFVCGSTLVCDNLDIARSASYEKNVEVKVVTLDGTVIHRTGLITGGRTDDRGSKRWDEREIQGVERQRKECEEELNTLKQTKRNLTTEESLTTRIAECEALLNTLRDDLSAVTSRLNGLNTELEHVNKQLRELNPELSNAQSAVQQTTQQMQSLVTIVDADDDNLFESFCQRIGVANIREYEEHQLRLIERQKDARSEFELQLKRLEHHTTNIKSAISLQEQRLAGYQKTVEKENTRLERIAQEKADIQSEIDDIQADIEEKDTRLAALQEEKEAKDQAESNANKDLSRATKALDNALKDIANLNDQMDNLSSQRTEIYRKCRLEEIQLPLKSGSLKKVALVESTDVDPMDVDEDGTQRALDVPDHGIEVDFSDLDDAALEDGSSNMENELKDRIDHVVGAIEKMAPNMKAADHLGDTETRFRETEMEFEKARKEAALAKTTFNEIKKRRCDLFNKAFNHISGRIDPTYKDLTKGKAAPAGGVAFLSLEDSEEPYLSGVKYHAMPPMKRFRDMDQLSGGEKTMAALALLFCIATFAPPPFFVLDEVDAALDSQNVAKVAAYIRKRARPEFQFIVISLKASLYEQAQGLVGIYRKTEDEQNSSASLTVDLEMYRG
ncbi:unnamed protein product [Sympodiomycopsis kandeliae]